MINSRSNTPELCGNNATAITHTAVPSFLAKSQHRSHKANPVKCFLKTALADCGQFCSVRRLVSYYSKYLQKRPKMQNTKFQLNPTYRFWESCIIIFIYFLRTIFTVWTFPSIHPSIHTLLLIWVWFKTSSRSATYSSSSRWTQMHHLSWLLSAPLSWMSKLLTLSLGFSSETHNQKS